MGSLVDHARLELFVSQARAKEVAEIIMDAAHAGEAGDGIIAIEPVETLMRIRTRNTLKPESPTND